MSSQFPEALDTFLSPTDPATGQYTWQDGSIRNGTGATAAIITPANAALTHEAQHDLANKAIAALEAKVGIDSSEVDTSIDYLLKSTSSVDPGHKHTSASINGLCSVVPVESGPYTAEAIAGFTVFTIYNSASANFIFNLPEEPAAGQIVTIVDASLTAATYEISVGGNGNNISGGGAIGATYAIGAKGGGLTAAWDGIQWSQIA